MSVGAELARRQLAEVGFDPAPAVGDLWQDRGDGGLLRITALSKTISGWQVRTCRWDQRYGPRGHGHGLLYVEHLVEWYRLVERKTRRVCPVKTGEVPR